MLERAIFSIDRVHDPNTLARFTRFVDTQIAMNNLTNFSYCIGSYKGTMEYSFMCLSKDLGKFLNFMDEQESVLSVPGDTRQPCVLANKQGQTLEVLGPMKEAQDGEDWTYVMETEKKWNTYSL